MSLTPSFQPHRSPFLHFVSDDLVSAQAGAALAAEFEGVQALTTRVRSKPGGDKIYEMDFVAVVVCSAYTGAFTLLPPAWSALCTSLASSQFRSDLSRQTGVDLSGTVADVGIYLHRAGDSVSVHRDKEHKALSCIVYLNEDWSQTDGGDFLLYSNATADPAKRITPQRGRAVAFAPAADSWHAVATVEANDRPRVTLQIEFAPDPESDA